MTVVVSRDWDTDGSSYRLEYTATMPNGAIEFPNLNTSLESEAEIVAWINERLASCVLQTA